MSSENRTFNMPPEDRVRLLHMRDAAHQAQQFLSGRTPSDLSTDRMLLFATVRAIEIVGEASARVTPDTREALPEMPWSAIIGMRNRLVHAYFNVDPMIIWRTVQDELPALIAALDRSLSQ